MYLPAGYKDAAEFFKDCGFEPVEWETGDSFDMRRPSGKGYEDAMQVTVRRCSVLERVFAAGWLLSQPIRKVV